MAHYTLTNRWALGDTVCISAAVRDFALAYGPKYKLTVTGHYGSFWKNNPYVTPVAPPGATFLDVKYDNGMELAKGGEPVHFATWFHREIQRLVGLKVPVTRAGGDIHLSPHERRRLVPDRYWVVVAGGKLDMTAKWWVPTRWQPLVDRLQALGIRCVQAGAHFNQHVHTKLKNCLDLTGATNDVRDLFTLIHGAEGVICGITGPMHIAAAFDKPCVVIAGGREAPAWEAYVNDFDCFAPAKVVMPHKFLHTIGLLPCAKAHGCWKTRTVAIEAADLATKVRRDKLCTEPVRNGQLSVPKCMDLITVDHVVEAVMDYYREGRLPPIRNRELTDVLVNPQTLQDIQQAFTPETAPPVLQTVGAKPNPLPREFHEEALLEDPAFKILDEPQLGGRVTICILSHGDQFEFFRRCIDGIINTVPVHRREIRVALNQPSSRLRELAIAYTLNNHPAVSRLYIADGPRYKYPAMRQMFYDPDAPLTTKYLVWFDDDSYPVDPRWLVRLAETIIPNHREGVRLFGKRCLHDLQLYNKAGHNPRQWFEQASWWRHLPLRLGRTDRVGPNGSVLDFCAGWFWALNVDTIRVADIPDTRLVHNGGDITIGAQVRQAGFKIKDFNHDKRFVFTPPKHQGGRRGYSEAFPWADPATRANHVPGT